jgi:hypothetical protein
MNKYSEELIKNSRSSSSGLQSRIVIDSSTGRITKTEIKTDSNLITSSVQDSMTSSIKESSHMDETGSQFHYSSNVTIKSKSLRCSIKKFSNPSLKQYRKSQFCKSDVDED